MQNHLRQIKYVAEMSPFQFLKFTTIGKVTVESTCR